jgi:hypothetical protein
MSPRRRCDNDDTYICRRSLHRTKISYPSNNTNERLCSNTCNDNYDCNFMIIITLILTIQVGNNYNVVSIINVHTVINEKCKWKIILNNNNNSNKRRSSSSRILDSDIYKSYHNSQ